MMTFEVMDKIHLSVFLFLRSDLWNFVLINQRCFYLFGLLILIEVFKLFLCDLNSGPPLILKVKAKNKQKRAHFGFVIYIF